MRKKYYMIRQVKLQTILILVSVCIFSGRCYENIIRKNEIIDKVKECKNLVQEAGNIFQAIDVVVEFVDDYWYDSIIKKQQMSETDADYTYLMTKEIISNQVLKGDDNWLFYKSTDDGDSIADFEGTNLYSDAQLEKMGVGILHLQNSLNYYGVKFQLLVCPNKEIVYHEYMPVTYKRAEKTKGDVLYEAFSQEGINIVYPKKELEANKSHQLYYTYDTHWNQLGAYVAVQKVLEQWGITVDTLDNRNVVSTLLQNSHHISASEDLAMLVGLLPILQEQKPDFEFCVEGTKDIDWEKLARDDSEKQISYFYNPNAKVKETLLLIGDSFRVAMLPLLSEVFENVYVVHRSHYKSDLLEQIKPHYVLAEYVERYADEITDLDENFFP